MALFGSNVSGNLTYSYSASQHCTVRGGATKHKKVKELLRTSGFEYDRVVCAGQYDRVVCAGQWSAESGWKRRISPEELKNVLVAFEQLGCTIVPKGSIIDLPKLVMPPTVSIFGAKIKVLEDFKDRELSKGQTGKLVAFRDGVFKIEIDGRDDFVEMNALEFTLVS